MCHNGYGIRNSHPLGTPIPLELPGDECSMGGIGVPGGWEGRLMGVPGGMGVPGDGSSWGIGVPGGWEFQGDGCSRGMGV